MGIKITVGKALATLVALFMATIWPAVLFGLPFIVIGLILIWFPDNRAVSVWLSRGIPALDSPPPALSFVGWLFLIAMPVLLRFVISD